ncbi:MAG: InlB B-repeat-containing protein [Treponema sp.]|jgi:hypothetical protein|nr:InlB B-repeat-containing protein [Treponema sp.]
MKINNGIFTILLAAAMLFASCVDGINDENLSVAPPTGLTVTETTKNSITLAWNSVAAVNYKIYQALDAKSQNYKPIAEPETPYFTVEDLESNTYYYFKVSAVDITGGEGTPSGYVRGRTTGEDGLYIITFESNGGSKVGEKKVAFGGIVDQPVDPTNDGFLFENWYSDLGLITVYDFNTLVYVDKILYAKWKADSPLKTSKEEREFNSNYSNWALPSNVKYPAIVEIFALGAGGGGQGGHYSDVFWPGTPSKGTGGAGGGGAAAYIKFSLAAAEKFNITIGNGGGGGSGVSIDNVSNWQSGKPGTDGGSTTVKWGNNTLTANGGKGGGGSGTNLNGGAGGAANTTWPSSYLYGTSFAGGSGTTGDRGFKDFKDLYSKGGNAASLSIDSVTYFGGSGSVRNTDGRPSQAELGGGGAAEYDSSRSGSSGGNGQVKIVVTWNE